MERTWEVGDKALCEWKAPSRDGLEVGKVYTVAAVFLFDGIKLTLALAELPSDPCDCGCGQPGGWLADRFRKLRPDRREGEMEDWRHIVGNATRKIPVEA